MNSVKNFLNKSVAKNMNMRSILYNRFVLYIFVFMALVNLMFFASTNDIRSLLTLLIVGFLTSFFSKNMIVILFVSLVFTHILKYGTNISEGMTNEADVSNESIEKSDKTKTITDNETPKKNSDKNATKKDDTENKKDSPSIESLQSDFQDFQTLQEKILKGMKEIDPLLTKAESFIEKFEKYKKSGDPDQEDD